MSRINPLDDVLKVVSKRLCIPVAQIKGRGRGKEILLARAIATWVLRRLGLSTVQISFALGQHEHASAILRMRAYPIETVRQFVEYVEMDIPPELREAARETQPLHGMRLFCSKCGNGNMRKDGTDRMCLRCGAVTTLQVARGMARTAAAIGLNLPNVAKVSKGNRERLRRIRQAGAAKAAKAIKAQRQKAPEPSAAVAQNLPKCPQCGGSMREGRHTWFCPECPVPDSAFARVRSGAAWAPSHERQIEGVRRRTA